MPINKQTIYTNMVCVSKKVINFSHIVPKTKTTWSQFPLTYHICIYAYKRILTTMFKLSSLTHKKATSVETHVLSPN